MEYPDPGKCNCGAKGDWRLPRYGKSGDRTYYWPTCPYHRDTATGKPLPASELAEIERTNWEAIGK